MLRLASFPLPVSMLPKHMRIPRTVLSYTTSSSRRTPPVCEYSSPTSPPPPTSVYVHLPFCRKRCHYCDFPIIALGSSSAFAAVSTSPSTRNHDDDPRVSNYINLLLREISAHPAANHPLDTIFFGGGTPSLVPPRLVAEIVSALRSKFGISSTPEVSIEMDPGTFDAARLQELVETAGVNRVSLGVQAFQEELLRSCGRAHGVEEVREAINIVTRENGVENWSMDLISSLPQQTAEMWEESLGCAADAEPTHISVYDLQVEKGTKFDHLYTPGEFPLPSETQSASFYKMASEALGRAGYEHYEISSYCKSGFQCKHNLAYWNNRSFYGFGLGSASYLNGLRFSRPRRLNEYMGYVQNLEEGKVGQNAGVVDAKDMAMDVLMLSLRTARGLDLNAYRRSFGDSVASSVCKVFDPYVESGHVIAMDEGRRALSHGELGHETGREISFIRLSDPEGFLLSNELISIAFGVISP